MRHLPQILQTEDEIASLPCDALVVGVFDPADGAGLSASAALIDGALGGGLGDLVGDGFKAKVGDVLVVPTLGRIPAKSVVLVGLGEQGSVTPTVIRRASAAAIRKLPHAQEIASTLHRDAEVDGTEACIEGYLLAGYRFDGYKKESPDRGLQRLTLAGADPAVIDRASARVEATILARDLTNEPASVLTPTALARRAEQLADVAGLECTVMGPDELKERGFGGILGVSAGSPEPPALIELRYQPENASGRVCLVGKGITFDTGGYSIKPAVSMETMKTDMAGAAAVLSAMGALGRLQINTEVRAFIPCAENMVSGTAIKPGDVITHYGGRTTEVNNTDAEGRLVLVDALVYACETEPDALVDIATLTGGIHIALGDDVAGLFYNDESLRDEIEAASEVSGEQVWRMPIIDRYQKTLESQVADMRASGSRWGSASTAAMFLRASVAPGVPWAHLDIAGPGRADSDHDEITKGGTGFGVRTILRWLEARNGGSA